MKNIFTPLASLLFFLCSTFVTAQVNLTLNVDMTYQSVSESGVHVAGSFQGWNPSSTQLTDDDGDNIYSVTISVDANSSHEYKFLNGNYWGSDEQVWGDCGAGNGNRSITLGDSDLSETAYYFGSCDFAIPAVTGCTDGSACNYFSDATEDDGSCEYAAEGYDCDGNEVCNYASVDFVGLTGSNESDGIYYLDFESYSPVGTSTDGYTAHIVVNGDSSAIDYNYPVGNNNAWYAAITVTPGSVYTWSATIETCGGGQTINGEYTSPIYGCTGPDHCNYDPEATMDDGSCIYAAEGFDCAGNCLSGELLTMYDSYGDGWNGAILTINGFDYTVEGSSASACVSLLECNVISWTSGAWDSETSWSVGDLSGEAGSGAGTYGDCGVTGCIDASACNYNEDATTDDGSCIYAGAGLDCDGNCLSGDAVTINMFDSYGDGGGSVTVGGCLLYTSPSPRD